MIRTVFFFFLSSSIGNAQYVDVPFEKDIIKRPIVDVISKVNIGESLILNKNIIKKEGIELISIAPFSIYSINHHLEVGQVIPLQSIKDNNKYYYDVNKPSSTKGVYFGLMYDAKNQNYKGLYSASKKLGGIGVRTKEIEGVEVILTDYLSDNCSTCYSYEFIFNGKNDKSLKFIYREFIKDLLRPSFTQELIYNLEEGNIVGFKNMRIEIIKVTNTEVEYKILNHLN